VAIIAGVVGARWPNLFIVGAPKGGTTTLWRYLDEHPDVYMSPEKEPNFFLDPMPPVRVPPEDAYLRLFSGARDETWLGEASGRYFSDPTTPGLIKARVADARILISLRDPVERAYSSYWHDVKFGIESRPFAEVVDEQLEDSRLLVGTDPVKKHVYLGFYSQHVARFLDVFGDAVRVGFLEDIHADPAREAASIFEFLGVDPDVAHQISPGAHNVFAQPRNRVAARLMASPRARAAGRAVFREPVRTWVENLVLQRGKKPPLDPVLRARLQEAFEADRGPLEQLLGRPVPWAKQSA
jgi:Sulfotransferase domain